MKYYPKMNYSTDYLCLCRSPHSSPDSILLTSRERQILQLIAQELTMIEIGHSLFISYHTVLSHRKNLMSKLGVKNTAGLVRRGFELQILKTKIPIL